MFDTLAHLLSEVMQRLGRPDEKYLAVSDVASAAKEALTLRGMLRQQSTQGRTEAHVAIFPSARDFVINEAPDVAVPLYIERRIGNDPDSSFEYVYSEDKSMIEESYRRGDLRAAYYRENDGLHCRLSYLPNSYEHRLYYFADPAVATLLTDPMGTPERWGYLLTSETLIGSAAIMMARNGGLPEEERLDSAQLGGVEAAIGFAKMQIEKWEPLFKMESNQDLNQRGRSRRSILGRRRSGRTTY